MAEYIDLVVVKHSGCEQQFLFQAPHWSYLEKSDRVVVETKKGNREAVVVTCLTCEQNGDTYKSLVEILKAKEPLKRVIGRIKTIEFDYPKGNENE